MTRGCYAKFLISHKIPIEQLELDGLKLLRKILYDSLKVSAQSDRLFRRFFLTKKSLLKTIGENGLVF